MDALAVLKESVKRVPTNKYALAVAGVVAAAVISLKLADDRWIVAVVGGVAVLAGMVVYRAAIEGAQSGPPVSVPVHTQVLVWICIVAFTTVLGLIVGWFAVTIFPKPILRPILTPVPAPIKPIVPAEVISCFEGEWNLVDKRHHGGNSNGGTWKFSIKDGTLSISKNTQTEDQFETSATYQYSADKKEWNGTLFRPDGSAWSHVSLYLSDPNSCNEVRANDPRLIFKRNK